MLVSVLALTLLGALVTRGVAALLGVPARVVVGLGRRLGAKDVPRGPIEIRIVPIWVATHLGEGVNGPSAALAGASGLLAVLLVPFCWLVAIIVGIGDVHEVEGPPLVVDWVTSGYPAEAAGIQSADVILEVEGFAVGDIGALSARLADQVGRSTALLVERGGERISLTVVPEAVDGRAVIGIIPERRFERLDIPLVDAIPLTVAVVGSACSNVAHLELGLLRPPPLSSSYSSELEVALPSALMCVLLSPWVALFSAIGQIRRSRLSRGAAPARPPR